MSTATVIVPECDADARQSSFIPTVTPPAPFAAVIFGANGDLANRKLFPALYHLWQCRYFPDRFAVVGMGRRGKSHDVFRSDLEKSLTEFRADSAAIDRGFLEHVFYVKTDFTVVGDVAGLGRQLQVIEKEHGLPGNRLYYLATDPEYFAPIVSELSSAGLVHRDKQTPWARVVIEKPFGTTWPAPWTSTSRCSAICARIRSIASITISARKPCKTCWRFASATLFSSRCSIGNMSSTSR